MTDQPILPADEQNGLCPHGQPGTVNCPAVTRPSPVVDGLTAELAAIIRTYCHNGVHPEPFGGSLDTADLAAERILTALAMRPAPETTASDDVVERAKIAAKAATEARFATRLATEDQRNGYEVGYYEALLAALANLPKPTEQATSPAPDAVQIPDALWPFIQHKSDCVLMGHWMEAADNECDCGLTAALASPASTAEDNKDTT